MEEPAEETVKADDTEEPEVPVNRIVNLVSSLDGATTIDLGTEATLTVEYEGFEEEDIAEIAWVYRYDSDPEGSFRLIDDAHDLTYTYTITLDNARKEWRVIIILK